MIRGLLWQAEGAQNEPFAVLAWRNNRECSRMISDPGAMQGDCLTVSGPLRMLHPRLQPSGIVADGGAFIPEE